MLVERQCVRRCRRLANRGMVELGEDAVFAQGAAREFCAMFQFRTARLQSTTVEFRSGGVESRRNAAALILALRRKVERTQTSR